MKNNLILKSARKLNEREMKDVIGGTRAAVSFTCSCSQHAGTWTGNYSSPQAIEAAIERYCDGGGSCSQN